MTGCPPSHDGIRMLTGFAGKKRIWTKMCALYIVAPGEISPASFSHPLLPTLKVVPQPVVAQEPHADAPATAKADKGAPESKPSTATTNLELKSTVGHGNVATPVAITPVTLRDRTHTADAAHANSMVTMSDASSGNNAPARDDHAARLAPVTHAAARASARRS